MKQSRRIVSLVAGMCSLMAVGLALGQQGAIAPGGAKVPAEAKPAPKPYDENADAKTQIADALAKAKKENRRVLIQWGGNWCPWCLALHGVYKSDKDIARKLMYEYDVVFIDSAGKVNPNKNLDLAASYGARIKGFPFLTILDSDGQVLINQPTDGFEKPVEESTGNKLDYDHSKILDFLTEHQAKYLEAQAVLDAGLAQAKAEHKRVFLHFGAPWCGWCKKMEAWMAQPQVHSMLSKDFVEVKIDQDRMVGGKDLKPKFGCSEKSGIPWYAFLDADGKVLADSNNGVKGNTGFPQDPDEIAYFESMLKKAAVNLNAEDIKAICTSLTPKDTKTALK